MNHSLDASLGQAFNTTYDELSTLLSNQSGLPRLQSPIAALQFALTFLSGVNYHAQTLLIANGEYQNLLRNFIEEHGSILFSQSKQDKEKYCRLSGGVKPVTDISQHFDSFMVASGEEIVGEECNFQTWNNYLSAKHFGKFSIWLSLIDKAQKDFRFSIDIFLILNVDIEELLPGEKDVFVNISHGDLEKWKLRHKLFSILYSLSHDYGIGGITKALNEALERQATRAAISQVMARNMSHNIGSHVLSRMVEKGTIRRIIGSDIFSENDPDFSKTQHQYQGSPSNDHHLREPENLIASFNSYMKSRMDYLADVTTGIPTIENSKWFVKELLSGIDKNRLLLDRISGVSDFHYRIKVNNLVGGKSDQGTAEDVLVSIPNDVLGCHAFYIILENIIRNCAKHGRNGSKGTKEEQPLNICIDIMECAVPEGRELYEVTIYDDSEVTGEVIINPPDEYKKYKQFFGEREGSIRVSQLDRLIFDQNYQLNQSVLKDGALRHGAWGLIEMDASAAYLRKIPIEEIDSSAYDLDLRQDTHSKTSYYPSARATPEALNIMKAVSASGKHLGYRLLMYKPREVLIIDGNDVCASLGEAERNELLKRGVLVADVGGRKGKFAYDAQAVYNHKLVVILSDDPDKCIDDNRTGLSERTVSLRVNDPLRLSLADLLRDDPKRFIEDIWKYYLKNRQFNFHRRYYGLDIDREVLNEILTGKDPKGFANYFGHGVGYSSGNASFKEIKYSAVEGFFPAPDEVVKGIQFIESVHTKIVVLDERIQEYAKCGIYKPAEGEAIAVKDIYSNTGIHVPDEWDCNLSSQVFDSEFGKILRTFSDHKDASFYVIHLGIIEKLMESYNRGAGERKYDKETQVKKFLEEVCVQPNNIDYNRLIVISGRGKPHNLPNDTRYLNYSIISQYMIDVRFKYLLSEAVFSARKLH